ncbi:MAG: spheroidene monooxygenase [Maricaulaceae bacterium]
MGQSVSISFFRFRGLARQAWAFSQMQLARAPLAAVPDIGFHKLFGTGTEQSFTPTPNFGVYAIMAVWPDLETGQGRLAEAAVFRRYREKASEHWTVHLNPLSAHGHWDGVSPFTPPPEPPPLPQPFGVLTRASVRTRALGPFWSHVPDISKAVAAETTLLFKMGMGEIPWVHQVTFSIWPDAKTMSDFAYRDGPHAKAIEAAKTQKWFSEDLFARFAIVAAEGRWEGENPLNHRPAPVAA